MSELYTSALLGEKSKKAARAYDFSNDMHSKYKTSAAVPMDLTSKEDTGFNLTMPSNDTMEAWTNFGGLALQLLGYSDRKKHMRAQTQALKQNIAQQKIDNAFTAEVRANLNKPMVGSGVLQNTVPQPQKESVQPPLKLSGGT